MMKRIIPILLLLFMGISAMAQYISVKSFQALPMDMTASSLEGKRIDQNNEVAALIKIVTSQTGFTFEAGALGIVDSKQETGEVWVWVPRNSRKITIKHQQLGVLRDYRYPIEIQAERTYEMVLVTGTVETIVKEEVRMQYLSFQITPPNAVLWVNEELWEVGADGTAMKFVDFGTYNYRVQAPNYHPSAGKVTVDDPKQTQRVTVNLEPDFVEVTLQVDADAEIWVNGEKKGTRTWTGSLAKTTYKIECKQAGHETIVSTQKITAEMEGQTITFPVPHPVYGSLNVESTPYAALYIDGKPMGETPCFIPEILIDQHEIKLVKEGYADHTETIMIAKGERKQVKATLTLANVTHMEGNPQPSIGLGSGSYNGHEYVDLGLPSGTLWATCNIGADTPEDYGDYFAWGETSIKSNYDWSTYKYCNSNKNKLTKYCNKSKYGNKGFTDNLTVLKVNDDAATANWGSGWCMPTKAQWEELKDNTTVVWTTLNGVNGRKFTASNGNSLFLPAAGFRNGGSLYNEGNYGGCWSSSVDAGEPDLSWSFDFGLDYYGMGDDGRYYGQSVRAIRSASQN